MNRLLICLILSVLVQGSTESEQLACTPGNVGAEAFRSITGYDQQVLAIADELAKTAENPEEFFIKLNDMPKQAKMQQHTC